MSATRLWDCGFTDLVSVLPPGAPISPNSRIDPSQRGKVPGRYGAGGWYGYNFTDPDQLPKSREAVLAWDKVGANVGLLGDRFPAVDIDCEDPRLTAAVRRMAEQHLGPAPVRLSRDPRAMLVYRTSEPFQRRAITVQFEGGEHTVEVLGKGRQFLVAGKHPAGVDYRWEGEGLASPDALTEVTEADIDAFLDALQGALEAKGLECRRSRDLTTDEHAPEDQSSLLAPSYEDLQDVVDHIPNGGERFATRDSYIAMGHAIKAAAGEGGFEVFLEWAMSWKDGENDPEVVAADWGRMRGPFRVGWHWLVDLAREGGYSSAQDEFDVDYDAVGPTREVPQLQVPGVMTFSDEWMTHMILADVRGRLLFIPGASEGGTWLVWNGFKWVPDQTLAHERLVRERLGVLAMHLRDLAMEAEGKEGETFFKAAKNCQTARSISSATRLLRAHLAAGEGDFDLDPYHLNTPEGTYNLRTGTLIEGDQMYKRATTIAPKAGEHPLWDAYLDFLTYGDKEYQRYLQLVLGYALTGDMSEKALWFIWGAMSNTGKSTFVNVVKGLMGDYAQSVDVNNFLASDSSALRPALAQLAGARLVTATEPAAGRAWDEEKIKAITGRDTIQTRALYGMPFTYDPQFKIIVIGNHEPSIKKMDDAMRRRIHILPFTRAVSPATRIPHLDDRIIAEEGPAVLAWMLEGCLAWLRDGLELPAVVRARTEAYADGEDLTQEWVEECCEVGADFTVTREELYASWADWARARGEQPGTLRAFRSTFDNAVTDRGEAVTPTRVETSTGSRSRGYRGIRLRPRHKLGTEEFSV